jgi:hypothetical protein
MLGLEKPSITLRIMIGKLIGFGIGLIGFILLPLFAPGVSLMFRFAILFWYTTFGALIGLFGVLNYHPVFKIRMKWWIMSILMGAWLNLVAVLLAYENFQMVMIQAFAGFNVRLLVSPFWFILEGALVGLLIGYFATRFGGEGKEVAKEMK